MDNIQIVHLQARNQEFFRAGEFSSNLGTSINICLQHEKERPRREKIDGFFHLETHLIHFKWEILPIDDRNQDTFSPN